MNSGPAIRFTVEASPARSLKSCQSHPPLAQNLLGKLIRALNLMSLKLLPQMLSKPFYKSSVRGRFPSCWPFSFPPGNQRAWKVFGNFSFWFQCLSQALILQFSCCLPGRTIKLFVLWVSTGSPCVTQQWEGTNLVLPEEPFLQCSRRSRTRRSLWKLD